MNTLSGTGNGNDSSLHVSNLEEDIEEDEERGKTKNKKIATLITLGWDSPKFNTAILKLVI